MLTKWVIANFKSIDDKVELDLAPLTLLVGPNSSGKSTIVQSILMIAQTLSSRRSDPQLLLNGEFVRLGVLGDLLHVHEGSQKAPFKKKPSLKIGFELQPTDKETALPLALDYRTTSIKADVKFESRRADTALGEERYPAVVRFDLNVEFEGTEEETAQTYQSYLRVTTRSGKADIPQNLFDQKKVNLPDLSFRPYMRGNYAGAVSGGRFRRTIRISSGQTRYLGRARRQTAELVPVGTQLNRFLPNRLLAYYNEQEINFRNYIDEFLSYVRTPRKETALPKEAWSEFVDIISTYFSHIDRFKVSVNELPDWLNRIKLEDRRKIYYMLDDLQEDWLQKRLLKSKPEFNVITVPIPEPFETAARIVSTFFTQNIKYLGPLREEPRLVYALPISGDTTDVGLKGEYTAAVLNANKKVQVSYCDPRTKDIVKAPLEEAVNQWLQHFGLADSVETQEASKLGHVLILEEANIPVYLDLTNVGVGVSQVLPILVSGLLAKEGTVLIYEQPEIHLHPRLQAEIADFFLGLIRCQKRCIVETHSEYMISRIRRRLAEAQNEDILSKVRLFFSEKIDSVSRFREISVNKYGAVIDWPRGFFDQAQQEAQMIIEASMRKRSEEKRGRSPS